MKNQDFKIEKKTAVFKEFKKNKIKESATKNFRAEIFLILRPV